MANFLVAAMGITSSGTFVYMREHANSGLMGAKSWLKNVTSQGADARLAKKECNERSAKPMPKGEVIIFDGSVLVNTLGARVALTESIEEIRASIVRSNAAAAAAEESRAKANTASVLLAPSPDAPARMRAGLVGKKDGLASASAAGALHNLRASKQKHGSAESGGSAKAERKAVVNAVNPSLGDNGALNAGLAASGAVQPALRRSARIAMSAFAAASLDISGAAGATRLPRNGGASITAGVAARRGDGGLRDHGHAVKLQAAKVRVRASWLTYPRLRFAVCSSTSSLCTGAGLSRHSLWLVRGFLYRVSVRTRSLTWLLPTQAQGHSMDAEEDECTSAEQSDPARASPYGAVGDSVRRAESGAGDEEAHGRVDAGAPGAISAGNAGFRAADRGSAGELGETADECAAGDDATAACAAPSEAAAAAIAALAGAAHAGGDALLAGILADMAADARDGVSRSGEAAAAEAAGEEGAAPAFASASGAEAAGAQAQAEAAPAPDGLDAAGPDTGGAVDVGVTDEEAALHDAAHAHAVQWAGNEGLIAAVAAMGGDMVGMGGYMAAMGGDMVGNDFDADALESSSGESGGTLPGE